MLEQLTCVSNSKNKIEIIQKERKKNPSWEITVKCLQKKNIFNFEL